MSKEMWLVVVAHFLIAWSLVNPLGERWSLRWTAKLIRLLCTSVQGMNTRLTHEQASTERHIVGGLQARSGKGGLIWGYQAMWRWAGRSWSCPGHNESSTRL